MVIAFTRAALAKLYRVTLKSCADILTSDRTPQKVTIEPIVPYTNVDIFREKGGNNFFSKNWEATEFYAKEATITKFLLLKLRHYQPPQKFLNRPK
jgi:hypothetical protein